MSQQTPASTQHRSRPKRPLRILMIAPTSFFSDYGGHIRILEETRTLEAMGHRVTIATYYKGSDMPGLDICRTAPLPWHTDYEVGSSRHKLAVDVYLAVLALRVGLHKRPDIIHGHMHEGALIGGLLARMLRIPMVFDFQGSLTAEMVDHKFLDPNGRIHALILRLEKFISAKLPSAVLTSSLQARQLLETEFNVDPGMIFPLPDCADVDRFHPDLLTAVQKDQLRRQLKIPLGRPIIAYLGLLTNYQGVPHLIEAAVGLKALGVDAHFLIMGYPNVDFYRKMAQENAVADRVTFTGKIEYRDAPLYLSLGDIAVAPKISSTEGSGKLLNYMAMAQPIVAYDTAVHREYLSDSGIYAPPGDVAAFTHRLADLLANPSEWDCLGSKLRQRAQTRYSWQVAGEQIVNVYENLI